MCLITPEFLNGAEHEVERGVNPKEAEGCPMFMEGIHAGGGVRGDLGIGGIGEEVVVQRREVMPYEKAVQ